jgi:hypothetical protein
MASNDSAIFASTLNPKQWTKAKCGLGEREREMGAKMGG